MSEVVTERPFNRHMPWSALDQLITPTDVFFCRNHNELPAEGELQAVSIQGRAWTLSELQALPQVRQALTLECAGNSRTSFQPLPVGTPWERRGLSTAYFEGPALSSLLPEGDWSHMQFESLDCGAHGPYGRSLTRQEVEELQPLLALSMNDAPLPHLHGGPVRLIVPGYFAMASVKWLARVECSQQPSSNFYQAEDYQIILAGETRPRRPVTRIRPKSMFSYPLHGAQLRSPVQLRGKAWGGSVQSVRVEVDGQAYEAQLGQQPGRWAWREFSLQLELPPGRHQAAAFCRAENQEQPAEAEWNQQGYENNSAHRIEFEVVG